MKEPIFVKLTVEGQRYEILRYISTHFAEMQEYIKKVVEDEVANFDFEGELRRVARAAIQEQVQRRAESAVSHMLTDVGTLRRKLEDMAAGHAEESLKWLREYWAEVDRERQEEEKGG